MMDFSWLNNIGDTLKKGMTTEGKDGPTPNWLGIGAAGLLAVGGAFMTSGLGTIAMVLSFLTLGAVGLGVGGMMGDKASTNGPIKTTTAQLSVDELKQSNAIEISKVIDDKKDIDHKIILLETKEIRGKRPEYKGEYNSMDTPINGGPDLAYAELSALQDEAKEISGKVNGIIASAEKNAPDNSDLKNHINERKQSLLKDPIYKEILRQYKINKDNIGNQPLDQMYQILESKLDTNILEKRSKQWRTNNWGNFTAIANTQPPANIKSAIGYYDAGQFGELNKEVTGRSENAMSNIEQAADDHRFGYKNSGVYETQIIEDAKDMIQFNNDVQARQELYKHKEDACLGCITHSKNLTVEPSPEASADDKTEVVEGEFEEVVANDPASMQRAMDDIENGKLNLGELDRNPESLASNKAANSLPANLKGKMVQPGGGMGIGGGTTLDA